MAGWLGKFECLRVAIFHGKRVFARHEDQQA
jgi:hypothetical protein